MRRKHDDSVTGVSIHSQVEGDILRVTVQGRLDVAGAERLIDAVLQGVVQSGVQRAILDTRRSISAVGPLHMSRNMMRISENEILASLKVAIVASARTSHLVYLEELAVHNSLPVRVFTDGVLAEQWLNDPRQRMAAAS
jgi:hypothetical protein